MRHAGIIAAACDADDYTSALTHWRSLFGPDFGNIQLSMTAAVAKTYAQAPPATEKFLDTHFGIPERLNPAYRVTTIGEVVPKRGFRNRPLPRTGDRVPKGRTIVFKVTECNVPEPYDVYWKIRNVGEEAEQANCLRGDIHKDNGSRSHTESTAYVGNHYVEALIVKNGSCVARSRQPVIVI